MGYFVNLKDLEGCEESLVQWRVGLSSGTLLERLVHMDPGRALGMQRVIA